MERGRWQTLAVLVAVDLAAKLAAYHLVRPYIVSAFDDGLRISVVVNDANLGSAMAAEVSDRGLGILFASVLASLAITLLLIVWRACGKRWPVGVVVAATVAINAAGSLLDFSPVVQIVDQQMLSLAARPAQTLMFITMWIVTRSPLWRSGFMLLAAAGIGNSLSLIYPPFLVIDFISWPLLTDTLGVGIFNFADVYMVFGLVVSLLALLRSCWLLIRRLFQTTAAAA